MFRYAARYCCRLFFLLRCLRCCRFHVPPAFRRYFALRSSLFPEVFSFAAHARSAAFAERLIFFCFFFIAFRLPADIRWLYHFLLRLFFDAR